MCIIDSVTMPSGSAHNFYAFNLCILHHWHRPIYLYFINIFFYKLKCPANNIKVDETHFVAFSIQFLPEVFANNRIDRCSKAPIEWIKWNGLPQLNIKSNSKWNETSRQHNFCHSILLKYFIQNVPFSIQFHSIPFNLFTFISTFFCCCCC